MKVVNTLKKFNSEFANSIWIFLEKSSKILVSFILGVYLARILEPEKFGIYTSAISFISIFLGVSAFGLNGILVKEFVKNNNIYLVLRTSFTLRITGVIFSYLFAVLIGFFFINSESVFSGIILVSILIFFTPIEIITFYFESTLKSKFNTIAKSFSFFIGATLKLILLFNGSSLEMLFLAHVLEGIIWFLILLFIFRKKTIFRLTTIAKTKLDFDYSKSLIKQSWPLLVSSIAVILYLKLDQIMILEYLGAENSGIYGVSVRVCEAIFLIPAIIVPSFFPRILNAFEEDKKKYLVLMRNILIGLGLLSILITIFLFVFSDFIIPYLFGIEYKESASVLKVYSISIMFVFFGHVISKWLIIEELTKLSILRHGMGVIVNISLNILFIPKYGIKGAAIASVAAYFVSTLGFMLVNKKGRKFIYELVF